jgi:hypothetical protein
MIRQEFGMKVPDQLVRLGRSERSLTVFYRGSGIKSARHIFRLPRRISIFYGNLSTNMGLCKMKCNTTHNSEMTQLPHLSTIVGSPDTRVARP